MALTTCHNRRELTLRALKSIYEQELPDDCSLEICLVDDGSTDGTGEAVRAIYPEVKVLQGTGDLYWARGMRFGWDHYVKKQRHEYLLVFNDDILLYPNALNTLLSSARQLEAHRIRHYAVSGAFIQEETRETVYGGVIRKNRWHPLKFKKIPPIGKIQECATINMNLVLISRAALDLTDFLSPEFVHKTADYDFGLRLGKAGGKVVLAGNHVGTCAINTDYGTAKEPGISFSKRWIRYFSVKGQDPKFKAIYYKRHAGFFWPVFMFISYIHLPFKGIKILFNSFIMNKRI
jgi:GT2 family glycosyltransferase